MSFVVLPDHPASVGVAAGLLRERPARVIRHASGRPWIVGHWSGPDLICARAGNTTVILLGRTTIRPAELHDRIRAVRAVGDLDQLARTVPGSVHLIAAVAGQVRVQGTLTLVRQVFSSSVGEITVAGDRPQQLAALARTGIDDEQVVLQLLTPAAPWPLSQSCLWRGVDVLAPGHCLVLRADGTARSIRWWVPPEPDQPLDSARHLLREALITAVEARTTGVGLVSADLSGGMDSTSLCFLAATASTRLLTYHHRALDPGNDDSDWAARCAAELAGVEHLSEAASEAPAWYARAPLVDADLEGPYPMLRTRGKLGHLARAVSARGSTRHLQGMGGDELFHSRPSGVHALARTEPLHSLPAIRIIKSMRRWSAAATLRYLLSASSYPAWLASTAGPAVGRGALPGSAGLDWEAVPVLPRWATPEAVASVRRRLQAVAAAGPQPLAPLPVQHEMLRAAQLCGTMTRRASQVTTTYGVSYEAPFLDDRVLEAAMSIRLRDRIAPGRYKPVLTAAMDGHLPEHTRGRATKGDYSEELYTGLRRHRSELLELWEDSHLVRMGLVDREVLQSHLTGLHTDTSSFFTFDTTLAAESWLRSVCANQPPDDNRPPTNEEAAMTNVCSGPGAGLASAAPERNDNS